MKRFPIILSASLALLFSSTLQAQEKAISRTQYCDDYHKKNCKFEKKDIEYTYNSQSRSALFRPGQISNFRFTAFKGYDYRVTFCADENLLQGQNLAYKVVDTRTKKVLYENSENNGNPEFEFICDNSINLEVQLELPQVPYKPNDKTAYGCVGFLIQSRTSLKTGF